MSLGTGILGAVWIFWIVLAFIAWDEVKWFGAILAVITIVLAVRNYYLKRK